MKNFESLVFFAILARKKFDWKREVGKLSPLDAVAVAMGIAVRPA